MVRGGKSVCISEPYINCFGIHLCNYEIKATFECEFKSIVMKGNKKISIFVCLLCYY